MLKNIKSRTFIGTAVVLSSWSLLLAWLPLTGVLGFEFNLFFGAFYTIVVGHFALSMIRKRAASLKGPSFIGTIVRVWFASVILLILPLLIICGNAWRVPNCNFSFGFALFGLYSLVGSVFGTSIGASLAIIRRKWLGTLLAYLIPGGCVLAAVFHGLTQPPIFAYDHFFGFYPGSIYDELRSVTLTLVYFRISTLALSGLLLGLVALFAGKSGILDVPNYAWREALLQKRPDSLDGRLRWSQKRESNGASIIWIIVCFMLYGSLSFQRHELGTEHTNQSIQKALGGRHETPHFILYYDQNAMSSKKLAQMARDHEFRYQQLVRFFGHRPKQKIESYLFKNARQKEKYMGAARTMIARPWAYQFYLHGYHFPHGVLKHEMAHVFTAAFGSGPLRISTRYGLLPNTALIEGVAVAADWSRREMTPHMWSRAMLDLGRVPDPAKLLNPAGFFSYASWTAYTVAGSFSRYLIDTYGMKLYKKAYGKGQFSKVYGKPLFKLSAEWKKFLRTNIHLGPQAKRIVSYRFRRFRSIFSRVCPHEIASLQNQVSQFQSMRAYPKAISLQEKICQLVPRSHHLLRRLRLYSAARKNQKAMRIANRLMKQFPAKNRPIYHARVCSEAGKLSYRMGQTKKALHYFKEAAKQHIYLGYQRSIAVYIYALEHPKLTRTLMRYLDKSSNVGELLQIQQAQIRNPNEPMLAYLLARRLYYATHLKQALSLLKIAQKGLKTLPFQAEILRLRARAHFTLGQYQRSASLFQELSLLALPKGAQIIAQDWKQRALWEKKIYSRPVRK